MAHEKLKEALHYVISLCDDPSKLGAIRLNKIMWFADKYAFRLNGATITADTYVKRRLGPVPKNVLAAVGELSAEGKVVSRETTVPGNNVMRHFFTLLPPENSVLSDQDRDILHSFSELICNGFTANEISDLTHDQVWEAAELGEEIPMFATFAQAGPITSEVRLWASEKAMALAS